MKGVGPHLPVAILLAVVALLPVGAGAETTHDDIKVEFGAPEEVELPPGGTMEIPITVTNSGTEGVYVAFEFGHLRTMGHPTGRFSTSYAYLEPGGEQRTVLTVTSGAGPRDDPSDSDFDVAVYWGHGLQLDDDGRPVGETVDGILARDFSVTFDADATLDLMAAILVIVLVVCIGLLLLYPGWRGGDLGP